MEKINFQLLYFLFSKISVCILASETCVCERERNKSFVDIYNAAIGALVKRVQLYQLHIF